MNTSTYIHRIKYYLKYLISAKSIHSIHSPFLFQFVKECFDKKNQYYCFDELNRIRKQLINDNTLLQYTHIGAHSTQLKHKNISIKKIFKVAVTPKKYSELYFKIINFLQAKTILELGTSLGLNTMYLAKGTTGKVITIEGQKSVYDYAKNLFKKNQITNIVAVNAYFDEALPEIIKQNTFFDVVFIDGNHTYEATKKYYTMLKPAMNNPSVIIIDDIYWSPEMTKAWKEIIQDKDIKISIDLYRCGIIIFNNTFLYPYHLYLRY